LSEPRRVAITGMAIHVPNADTPQAFLNNLLEGRSAITNWKSVDTGKILAKVGADLGDYDVKKAVKALEGQIPDEVMDRLRKIIGRAPFSTAMSMLAAVRGCKDAGWYAGNGAPDLDLTAGIVAGHNLNAKYIYQNHLDFADDPDFIDGLLSLHSLDTDHAGSVSEVLQTHGPIYTIGGACASGNHALRAAVDEIKHHGMEAAVVVGAVLDVSMVDLHAMALMGAITHKSFNDDPEHASRPFDTRREGFVPAHGGGALILEDWDIAKRRGAKILAEIVGVEASADGNHLPNPSEEGQYRLMTRLMKRTGIAPEQIDYVNAHATSTPLGDLTEIRSIRRAFGSHAKNLKINATKSMLGHTCWAAPVVETIAVVTQMNAGRLHPSINVENLDPEVDLDVCANEAVDHEVQYCLKNSFGFGGINAVSILRKPDPSELA